MPRRYPSEFRRKVLELLKSGRTVAEAVATLDVTKQRLAAARRRIAELETELAIAKRSTELLKSSACHSPRVRPPCSF